MSLRAPTRLGRRDGVAGGRPGRLGGLRRVLEELDRVRERRDREHLGGVDLGRLGGGLVSRGGPRHLLGGAGQRGVRVGRGRQQGVQLDHRDTELGEVLRWHHVGQGGGGQRVGGLHSALGALAGLAAPLGEVGGRLPAQPGRRRAVGAGAALLRGLLGSGLGGHGGAVGVVLGDLVHRHLEHRAGDQRTRRDEQRGGAGRGGTGPRARPVRAPRSTTHRGAQGGASRDAPRPSGSSSDCGHRNP